MIVSASRRTDLPAWYADWLYARVAAGYALSRNPMNRRVYRVELSRDAVDGFVFWSKNPAPMLDRLGALDGYAYYFQYTLNGYGADVEPGVPELSERIDTFRRLADRVGAQRVLWRYDPVLISPAYPPEEHEARFAYIADALTGYTRRVTISFLDLYAGIARAMQRMGAAPPDDEGRRALAARFAAIGRRCGMTPCSCAEALDYGPEGVARGSCVDAELLSRVAGRPIAAPRDKNMRAHCGCAKSVDIGLYDSCPSGCAYCYANHGKAARLAARHDPAGEMMADE